MDTPLIVNIGDTLAWGRPGRAHSDHATHAAELPLPLRAGFQEDFLVLHGDASQSLTGETDWCEGQPIREDVANHGC
jgi:hypothetical protein